MVKTIVNMKNKIYSSRFIVYLSLFAICFLVVILFVSICQISLYPTKAPAYIPIIIILLLWLSFFCFLLNRLGYRITYDNKSRTLYRKGFIYGYFHKIEIDDIKEIISVPYPKERTYYVIIDSNQSIFDGAYKKSYLRMEKTNKNKKFIEQFWDKPIKEYKQYEDLLKQK